MDNSPRDMPIRDIRQNLTVWPRAEYDEDALARYRDCPDLPPVRVDRATGVLLDGFHRVRVHQEAGAASVPVIFEDCPAERHLARALELNRHGAPIPLAQRDRIIRQLAEQGLTQAEIAKAAGLSQKRVSQILAASKRDSADRNGVAAALRLVDDGASLREAEKATGVPRSTLERAVVEAKARQEAIRRHLQTRAGLTSLLRYPERGPWGRANYFGNAPGYLLVDLFDYFKPASVFDPMEGSGTTREVCADLKIDYEGRDLVAGFDLLSSPLPARRFDLVFWHPPYWPGHRYSDHPNDFSNADGYDDFRERVRAGFERLREVVTPTGHLAILIGDGRKNGVFFPIHSDIIGWGVLPLEAVLIKDGQHERQAQHFRYGPSRFIPTLHEYLLVFRGGTA